MTKLDESRVDAIYTKLTGKKPEQGAWNVQKRNLAQKVVYIDEACKSVLAAIHDIEHAPPGADMFALEAALRKEFKFLDTLRDY